MIVEVKNVSKTYDDGKGGQTQALRDVNLTFPQGQLSTLLGPSGCGATGPAACSARSDRTGSIR